MAHGMRQHASSGCGPHFWSGIRNDDGKEGAAWIAGKALWPTLLLPSKPKAARAVLYVIDFQMRHTFGYMWPM